MAFWEVNAPLGGLSLSAASRGQEGWGQRGWGAVALVMVMGRWGWAPLLPLHGHVKVAFYRETPEGAMRGGWHSSGDNRGGRLCMRERCSDELTAPERAGIGRKKDDKHHFGYQSRNMFKAAAGIRPSEGMRERLEGGFLLMPHRDNT